MLLTVTRDKCRPNESEKNSIMNQTIIKRIFIAKTVEILSD